MTMSKHTRAITRRQLMHISSRSRTHKLDKENGEARRLYRSVRVKAEPHPGPHRSFGDLEGFELVREPSGGWRRCSGPDEQGVFLCREAKDRSKFQSLTKRRGKPVLVTRRDPAPLHVLTISWHPAVSDLVADSVNRGDDPRPKLRLFIAAFIAAVEMLLEGVRYLLAVSIHLDTDDGHTDLVVGRQGPLGRIGRAGLRLVGPWLVAVDRQIRSGALVSSGKLERYQRSVANFRRRYGDVKPLDVKLARVCDETAENVWGEELEPFIGAYAKRVPDLEQQHLAASLREIDRVRAELISQAEPPDGPSRAGISFPSVNPQDPPLDLR